MRHAMTFLLFGAIAMLQAAAAWAANGDMLERVDWIRALPRGKSF